MEPRGEGGGRYLEVLAFRVRTTKTTRNTPHTAAATTMSVSTEFYQNIEKPKSRFEVIVVAEIPLIIKTEIRPLKGPRPISHINYINFSVSYRSFIL